MAGAESTGLYADDGERTVEQMREENMNIQIFGTKKCNDTKKAERFFKERR